MKTRKPKFMDALMAELINYGGFAMPRSAVYEDALKVTGSKQAADMFAFGPRAKELLPDEASRLIPASQFAELAKITK